MPSPASETALFQRCGTRPRFANSSRTRDMTPGSASARIEKETESGSGEQSKAVAAAGETEESIADFLGRWRANRRGPGPNGTRDANSPDAGAMRRHAHGRNVSRRAP